MATEMQADADKARLGRIAHRAREDSTGAAAELRLLIVQNPDALAPRRLLAAILRADGDREEGRRLDHESIALAARDPRLVAARTAIAEGQLEPAEVAVRAYLHEDPLDPGAALMLSDIALRCGVVPQAETFARRALQLAPGYTQARIALAKILHRQGRNDEALAELDVALEGDPDDRAALSFKAAVETQTRRLDSAAATFQALVRAHPEDARGWTNYAFLLKTIGEAGEAVRCYRRALAIAPASGRAWWGLANLKTVRFGSADVDAMLAALSGSDLSADDRLHLQFALGKALADQNRPAEAFSAYAEANRMRREQVPHDPAGVHRDVLRTEKLFTPEFLAARAGGGSPARDPIFILGMPRSGSTLVEQILASHSLVEGTEELWEIEKLAIGLREGRAAEQAYIARVEQLTLSERAALGEAYLAAARPYRMSGRPYFTDKMPGNWAYIGLIHLILPNARIIDVRRHPLGCGFANFTQHFNWGINFSYDLADIGFYYADYVRAMAHWDRVLPGRIHRVFYEDLIDKPEGEIRRLLAYCGLPFEDACLRFHETRRAVHTPSAEQVRRPINREGAERWRVYEPWLEPLKQALGPVLALYPHVPGEWSD